MDGGGQARMRALTWDIFTELARSEGGLFASIYVPMGAPGDARPGHVRLHRAWVEAAGELQAAGLPPAEADAWAAAGREAVADDPDLQRGGTAAVFLGGGRAEPVHVADGVRALVRVEARPYVVPLVASLQGDGVFFVLALSRHGMRLLRCTRAGAVPVDSADLAQTMTEVLGPEYRPHDLEAHRYGGAGGTAVYHGQGGEPETIKDRTLRYFQAMAPRVREALGHERSAPMILAGVEELFPIYRQASGDIAIRPGGLAGNAEETPDLELVRRALPLVAPVFEQVAGADAERFDALAGTGLATAELAEVAVKARDGLVDTLFLIREAPVWGRYDPETDRYELHDARRPGDEDVVNAAVVHAHLSGARIFARPVYGVSPEAVAAAILRA